MGVRAWLANAQLGRMRKKTELATFSIPSDLLKTKHILVCLPGGLRELTMVKQFLPVITTLFRQADVTLLAMPGIHVTDIYPRKGFQIITPSVDQMGWAGLPKKTFLSTLSGYNFDMVLDMNLEPSMFISCVLLNFSKAIRIGRGNHLGKPFYNLEIKTKYLRDERNIYRSMLETLGDLMNRRTQLADDNPAHTAQED